MTKNYFVSERLNLLSKRVKASNHNQGSWMNLKSKWNQHKMSSMAVFHRRHSLNHTFILFSRYRPKSPYSLSYYLKLIKRKNKRNINKFIRKRISFLSNFLHSNSSCPRKNFINSLANKDEVRD